MVRYRWTFVTGSAVAVALLACVGADPSPTTPPAADSGSGNDGGHPSLPDGSAGDAPSDSGQASDGNGDSTTDATSPVDAGPVPATLPGLTLWLDATRGLGPSPSVSDWVDQVTLQAASGTAEYASGSACAAPSRIDGAVKGLPVVRFNGSTNCLVLGDSFYDRFRDFRAGVTIFILARPAASMAIEGLIDFSPSTGSSTDWVSVTRDGDKPRYNLQTPTVGLSTAGTSASAFLTDQAHLLTILVQPGDAGSFGSLSSVSFFVDGVKAPTSSSPTVYVPNVTNRALSTIGRLVPGNGLPTFNSPGWYRGDLGEIIMYLRTLSEAESLRVQGYLTEKWL